ncbi:MAG: hypothetical protein Q8896_12785, partial [Bacteroidota bacterium]|nr:hypothetical protein [Bacteroidota bacterium]
PSFQGISLRLTGFYFNSETKEAQPILFSKRVDIAIPNVKYPVGSGLYSFEFKNLHGNSEDSVITADHFGFVPNFSDQAFAARSRYAAPKLDFESNGVRIEGFNFASAVSHSNLIFRTFKTSGWLIDSYEDRSKPSNPNPPKALMPNDLISSLPVKLDIDSMIFSNGEIRIREHKNGTTASLGFTRANVTVSPISKDTIGRHSDEASRITFRAYFLGVAELAGTAVYPLHHKNFDLDIHADLGGFPVERLNPWLVPFERVEVTGGQVRKGTIDMSVRSGVATTTVVPIYSGFSVKVLAADPHAQPGLMEKLKTFIAKTFILDHENPDEDKILPGITTHARGPSDEFMQFIWESLRASLGQVVGFQRTG